MTDAVLSALKKDFIHNLIVEGKRADGRDFREMRDISVQTHVIAKAEGSAYVKYGETKILVGIKLQKGTPFPDSPNSGIIMTGMELNPLASPNFEAGPPKEEAIEMSRIVDRGIRESHSIDLEKLCIREGELVWMVFVDISVINDAGNIVDASALASIAALLTTTVPADDANGFESIPLPMQNIPVGVTVASIDNTLILDPSLDEENVCDTKLTIITENEGALSGMQKSGAEPLLPETVIEMVNLAREKGAEIRERYLSNLSIRG
ncbi:Ribonuclease PH [Methanimicrococcus stummii]|uniref:Exosome complex component Rrp42 n=1 Tax=Methanimicrococcus stummii TaxID=3028294 RepID=A0AA96ZWT3_9EURY|nr:exosome complex protein Rrp42 [Methanimicrococcus sp. Es2]WNY28280.1 Ribonuclease PH [Methanimicrococcus sp. Es2]